MELSYRWCPVFATGFPHNPSACSRRKTALKRLLHCILVFTALLVPGDSNGQTWGIQPWTSIASEAEDRLRLDQLLNGAPTAGYLLRTPSLLLSESDSVRESGSRWAMTLLPPELRSVSNSDLPVSMNDGALWAGAGWSAQVTAGVRLRVGRTTLIMAPDFLYQENAPFQFIVFPQNLDPPRKIHADPFHPLPESIDKPVRFGEETLDEIGPGQSSLTVRLGPVSLGAATENTWWGPGIRNGIIMSNHAPGVPRLFLRTSRPIETRAGTLEGRWILGRLEESDYFDLEPSNDERSLSGLVVTLQPSFEPGLTLGLARVVYAPKTEEEGWTSAAFDVFRSVGRPNSSEGDSPTASARDQIFTLFGRWVFSPAGFEVYGEWARFEQPASVKDFLQFPGHSQGYTAGFQWAARKGETGVLRVQAEMTNLEPSGTWRVRSFFTTYTSRVVPQGYTHRGQVIGAGIGPGASSQWLAFDFMPDGWRAGVFGGRIRWDNSVIWSDVVFPPKRSDVSLFWGLRGAVDLRGWNLAGELSYGIRLNYLFQTFAPDPITGRANGVDIANTTLTVTLAKVVGR